MNNKITNNQIIEIWEKVNNGSTVKEETNKYGISREWYYQKIKELNMKNKKEQQDSINTDELLEITNIDELSKLLDTDNNTIYKYSNLDKPLEANRKRMSYLKNKSPEKFQEAILITIINFYNVSPIQLIKLLKIINK